MDITYKVSPTFAKIHRDTNPYLFIMGPVGSGKSSGCVFHAFLNAMRQHPDKKGVRHYKHLVVRATYPALTSTVIPTWISWFQDKITITYSKPIIGRLRYPLDDGTTVDMEIIFMGVADDKSAEKLRSLEVTSVHCNEASELSEGTMTLLKSRYGRYPAEKDGGCVTPFILLDYNAVSTDHWLYRLAEEDRPEGHSFYRQPPAVLEVEGKYIVNPEAENLANLRKGYYEELCLGSSPDFINVNVMNNYGEVQRGKPVYKDYVDLEHHTDDKIQPLHGVPVVIGMDMGMTPAACFTQQQPDGTIIVFDEIATDNCSIKEFCEDHLWPMISSKYPSMVSNFKIICDPAAVQRSMNDARSALDVVKACNLPAKTARTNTWVDRFGAVSNSLRLKGRFKLGPNCPVLRKGFVSEYKYAETRTVNGIMYKATPLKNEYSHIHDALQYAMLEHTHGRKERKFLFSKPSNRYRAASQIGGY